MHTSFRLIHFSPSQGLCNRHLVIIYQIICQWGDLDFEIGRKKGGILHARFMEH